MSSAMTLRDLLDRADSAFLLAAEVSCTLEESEKCAELAWQVHEVRGNAWEGLREHTWGWEWRQSCREPFERFKDAIFALETSIVSPPVGFEGVASVLRNAGTLARAMLQELAATSDGLRWTSYAKYRTPMLEVCREGHKAVLAARVHEFAFLESSPVSTATQPEPLAEEAPAVTTDQAVLMRLVNVYSENIADEKFRQVCAVLTTSGLTADERLTKWHGIMRIPQSASAQQLADAIGKAKTTVLNSAWWKAHREGERKSVIGRRQSIHQERSKAMQDLPDDA